MSGYIPGILANGTVAPSTTAATIRSNIAAVGGSLGSTDNRVLRADGTGGSTAQGSAVTIDDSGNVSGVGTFTASGSMTFTTTVGGGGTVFSSGVFGVTPSTQTSLVHGGTGVCYLTTANGLTVLNGISASSSLNVAPSVWLTRASDGVWRMGTAGNNASGSLNLTNLTATGLIGLGAYTVATLPSAAANLGRIAQVTDSSVTTNGSAVSGGGANRVMVFSNGSTWDVAVA